MGRPVEVGGIKVTIDQRASNCWDLDIENTRLLHSIKPDEGGVVRAVAGIQNSVVYLVESEDAVASGDYDWGDLAPIKRGETRSVTLCEASEFAPDQVEIHIAGSTIEFS